MDTFLLLSSHQWQAIGSIGTLLAVLAALAIAVFQDKMRAWFHRPKLKVSFEMVPPCCDKILYVGGPRPAQAYSFRARISNDGNRPANNVEVLASDLFTRGDTGDYTREPRFMPMRLTWTNLRTVSTSISPRLFSYIDLFHIIQPDERPNIPGEDFFVSFAQIFFHHDIRNENVIAFDTEVKPLTSNHLVPAGNYRLALIVGSENSRPVRRDIQIDVKRDWDSNRDRMLSEIVAVALL